MLIQYYKSRLSERLKIIVLTVLLVMIGANTFLAMDMYVPSMPSLVHYFASTATAIKLTITYYLAGLILAPLFYGPLSDAFGRRNVLMVGISINLCAAVLCLLAKNLWVFNLGRFFQGVGVAVGITIIRTMVRDRFRGQQYTIIASNISLLFSVGPAIMPPLGGYLQHAFGWHAIFYAIIAYAFFSILLIAFLIPETNQNIKRSHLNPMIVLGGYKSIFLCRNFLTYAIASGLGIGIIIGFITVSSFLIQTELHYSALINGWVILFAVVFSILGKAFNSYLVKRMEVPRVIFIGVILMLLSGVLMFATYFMLGLNLMALVGSFIIYVFGFGLVSSNAMIMSFKGFRKMAGVAGAAYSSLQMLLCCLVSVITAHMSMQTQLPLASLMVFVSATILALYLNNQSRITP
jgi:MFS transporter, DHA1 family, multidrug resistance protein